MTDLSKWVPRKRPDTPLMAGRYIDVVRYHSVSHGKGLWEAFGGKRTNELLFHFGWPVMDTWKDLADLLDDFNSSGGFVTYVFAGKGDGTPLGMASYMNIVVEHGAIETGSIAHGAKLQRSRGATEGHYLMARYIFDELEYRRYEWKLNNPNQASHNAAKRFGFTFEGVFRQHQVKPYGNRDTAWYSMLDVEWPLCKKAFEAWLSDDNFDAQGQQNQSLENIRRGLT